MSAKAWERVLRQTELLNEAQLAEAASKPQPLQYVVDQGWAQPEPLLESVSAGLKIAFTRFSGDAIDAALVEEIGGADRWLPRLAIPLVSKSHRVRVAVADPMDLFTVDEFTTILNRQVEVVLALPSDIERQFQRLEPERLNPSLKVCPHCEGNLIPIVYGYPGPEMMEQADRGEIMLGGCIVGDDDPKARCMSCGRRYR